jgi:Fe2+ or Zn2+ uptake regulation protein
MNTVEKQRRMKQFAQADRENGLPVRMQRRAVFETVLECDDYSAAGQVCAAVREELTEIPQMTVSRILNGLVAQGLISMACHPGSVAWPDVRALRFEIEDYHIHFRGRCVACRQAAERSTKPRTQRRQPP